MYFQKLNTAVKEGNEEGLKLCIKEGADKDYKDEVHLSSNQIQYININIYSILFVIIIVYSKFYLKTLLF